jgi:hypothetical protein
MVGDWRLLWRRMAPRSYIVPACDDFDIEAQWWCAKCGRLYEVASIERSRHAPPDCVCKTQIVVEDRTNVMHVVGEMARS